MVHGATLRDLRDGDIYQLEIVVLLPAIAIDGTQQDVDELANTAATHFTEYTDKASLQFRS